MDMLKLYLEHIDEELTNIGHTVVCRKPGKVAYQQEDRVVEFLYSDEDKQTVHAMYYADGILFAENIIRLEPVDDESFIAKIEYENIYRW